MVLVLGTGAFFVAVAAVYVSKAWPTGDEPHYLVITETLLKYHSLDVTRAYLNHDYRAFYDGTLNLSHTVTSPLGVRVPVHGIGGPLLWLPFFALAGRMGVVLFIAGVSLLVIAEVFLLLREQGIRRTPAAAVAAVLPPATPFFAFSHLIFVDLFGALAVVHVFRNGFRPAPLRVRDLVSSSLVAGILPWIHVKFILVEVLLLGFLLARVLTGNSASSVPAIGRTLRSHWRQVCWALFPAALLAAGFEVVTYSVWESLDPLLAYGTGDRTFPLTASPVRGLVGTFLDQEYGIFMTAPVLVLAVPGFVLALRDKVRPLNLYFIILAVGYLSLFIARQDWEGGWTPPGRFVLVLLPLFAYYIAYLVDRPGRPLTWPTFWILSALGTAYNLLSVQTPGHGFNAGVGRNQTVVYLQQLVLHRSVTQYLPSTVREVDYARLVLWVLVLTAVCALALLNSPSTHTWSRGWPLKWRSAGVSGFDKAEKRTSPLAGRDSR